MAPSDPVIEGVAGGFMAFDGTTSSDMVVAGPQYGRAAAAPGQRAPAASSAGAPGTGAAPNHQPRPLRRRRHRRGHQHDRDVPAHHRWVGGPTRGIAPSGIRPAAGGRARFGSAQQQRAGPLQRRPKSMHFSPPARGRSTCRLRPVPHCPAPQTRQPARPSTRPPAPVTPPAPPSPPPAAFHSRHPQVA
jgi:hypothetical protein